MSKEEDQLLDTSLNIRISSEMKEAFIKKHGRTYTYQLRDLIEADLEGRMTIKPKKGK